MDSQIMQKPVRGARDHRTGDTLRRAWSRAELKFRFYVDRLFNDPHLAKTARERLRAPQKLMECFQAGGLAAVHGTIADPHTERWACSRFP